MHFHTSNEGYTPHASLLCTFMGEKPHRVSKHLLGHPRVFTNIHHGSCPVQIQSDMSLKKYALDGTLF